MLDKITQNGFYKVNFFYELTYSILVSFRHPNINELFFSNMTDFVSVFDGTYVWKFLEWIHIIWNEWYVLEGVGNDYKNVKKNDSTIFYS